MQKVIKPTASVSSLLLAQCATAVRNRRPLGKISALLVLSFFIAFGLTATSASAQHQVTGEVVDAEEGSTLPGVNIVVMGTQTGTTTRANGTYSLEAPSPTDTLVFSFVGYEQQEVPIESRSEIDIALEPAVTALEEVVVQVGYEERTVETVTGSVSQVSGADLEAEPSNNITQMLQGTVPGMVGVQSSGRPGFDDSNLLIRGSSTLNDNDPLVVIDGVPNRQGGLARLNPNDIESISVLKDASAAIYGSRAANGVILVTTKRGTAVGGTQVSASVRQAYTRPTVVPDMADAPTYMTMLNEIDSYRGTEPRFSQEEIDRHRNCPEGSYECFNTDWYDQALRDFAPRTMANVAVTGGSEAIQYRVSLRGVTEEGILVNSGTGYDQLGFRSNLDGQVTDNFSLSLDMHGRLEDRNTPAWTRGLDSAWEMLQRGFPTDPAFWPDGSPGPAQEQGVNPVVAKRTGYDNQKSYFFQSSLTAEVEIPAVDGWTVEGTVAYDHQVDNNRRWQKPWVLYNFGGFDENDEPVLVANEVGVPDPRLNQFSQNQQEIMLRATTRYETAVGSHYGSLLLGSEYQRGFGRFTNAWRRYFPTEQIQELFAGGTQEQSINGNSSHSTRLNFFGRASYNYDERYLLELVGRYDGSYQFPEGDRFGFFPSVSAGWNIAREGWFADATGEFFDRLQLRSSFGQTGNDQIVDPNDPNQELFFQYLRTFGFTTDYAYGDGLAPSIAPTRVPNPDITWEVATQFDVGINGSFLDDRLSFETTYFNHFREDILWFRSESVPLSAGFTLPAENIGEVRSWGLEGEVQYVQQLSQDATLRVGGNMSWAKDEVVFIDEPEGLPEWQQAEGKPMNTGLYYVADGIFNDQAEIDNNPSWSGARPGDVRFRDVNGDGVIDGEDRVRQDVTGEPDLIGSFHLGATVHQFDARLQFQGATRVNQYVFTGSAGEFGNYFQEFADQRWTPDNPDASGPRAYNRVDPYWASNGNTHFLQDASYLRLKSARIGYQVPSGWAESLGIDQLRIDLSGRNLLTWTPLKIMDPEIRNGAAHTYPPERAYSVELQVNF